MSGDKGIENDNDMDISHKYNLPDGINIRKIVQSIPSHLWENNMDMAMYLGLKKMDIFNKEDYLNRYPNIRINNFDPILHYIMFGKSEGKFFRMKKEGNDKKNISVIIPTYNSGKFIERAINSVLEQTFQSFEIIIYDDSSIDDTIEVIEKYLKKYDYIKLICGEKNMGQGVGRNIALKHAEGKYITFLDSDDYYNDINYFQYLINTIQDYDADVIITSYMRQKNNSFKKDEIREGSFTNISGAQLFLNREFGSHGPCAKLYKSNLAKKYQFSECGYSQDVKYVLDVILHANKVISKKYYGYVYYNDNYSSWRPKKITNLHFFSSIRLIFDILITLLEYDNKNNNKINTGKFLDIYRADHKKRIITYLNTNRNDRFVENLLIHVGKFISIIMYAINDSTINRQFLTYVNTGKNLSQNKYDKCYGYIEEQTKYLDRLLNDQPPTKGLIVIYLTRLAFGGLERVACEMGNILSKYYEVVYLVDDISNCTYKVFGKIFKADLFDAHILTLLSKSKYIIDFKYKSIKHEFPIIKYCLDNYSNKYILTVHNTKTFYDYTEKVFEYLPDNDLNNIHKILCVSSAVSNIVKSKYDNIKNIDVLYNPVNMNNINKYEPCDENNFILFAGRLSATEHKGIDILINSYHQCVSKSKYSLFLAGSGNLDNKIVEMIKEYHLENKIKILGFKENIYSYMKSAKFVIAPSRWEGFSMTLIESLACDTPVLTTRTGGANEVINNNINGCFININDVSDTAYKIDYMCNSFIKRNGVCRESVKKFDVCNYEKNILNILK